MTDTQVTEKLMTLEEFVEAFDKEPFDLIDGEITLLSPTMYDHGNVQSNLLTALTLFIVPRGLGKIYVDSPFVLTYQSGWVKGARVPDLMYFGMERLAAYKAADPEYGHKPFVLTPDLAVEIISPTDSFTEVHKKIKAYLNDGVRLVWVFDLAQRAVIVVQPNLPDTVVQSDDNLTGGEVIPGFEVRVSALFE